MQAADPGGHGPDEPTPSAAQFRPDVSLLTIAREWGRMGCIGFGGPPAHIALLRALCVDSRGWMSAREFEDGVAAANLLPGPASTQLAIFCAWRLRGPRGALVGGACFIVPGLIVILALSHLWQAGVLAAAAAGSRSVTALPGPAAGPAMESGATRSSPALARGTGHGARSRHDDFLPGHGWPPCIASGWSCIRSATRLKR